MVAVILDTCVWLNLAKQTEYYPIIEGIKEILVSNEFQLIVPEIIMIELQRNRTRLESDWMNQVKGYLTNLNNLCRLLPSKKTELIGIIEETRELARIGGEGIRKNLELIDQILNTAIIFEATNEMMIEASHRSINHLPPATSPSRSSPGDCLIWLSVLEKLKEGEVWFCTDNKNDFSLIQGRLDMPNELLDSEAFSVNSKGCFNYFIEPTKLVEKARIKLEHAQKPLPAYRNYDPLDLLFKQSNYSCFTCGSLNVWINIRTLPEGWMKFLHCHDCGTVDLIGMVEAID